MFRGQTDIKCLPFCLRITPICCVGVTVSTERRLDQKTGTQLQVKGCGGIVPKDRFLVPTSTTTTTTPHTFRALSQHHPSTPSSVRGPVIKE